MNYGYLHDKVELLRQKSRGDLVGDLRETIAQERSKAASDEFDLVNWLLLPEGHDIKIWWERRDRQDPEVARRGLEITGDGWLRIWFFQMGEFRDWAQTMEQAICFALALKFTLPPKKR